MLSANGYAPDAAATFALVRDAIRACADAGASASDDPHADTWLIWAALHGVATLEKPARSDYLRLGPLDRPGPARNAHSQNRPADWISGHRPSISDVRPRN